MIKSFLKLLTRCYRLALPYGRLKLFAVLALIFLNGLLQLIGVSSVFPFFALAADPDRIRRSAMGEKLLGILPPMSTNQLLVVAGCFAILMLFIASFGSMAADLIRIRYAYGFCHWLRQRLLKTYASKPYAYFLQRNSSILAQRVWDILTFINSVLIPIGEVISRIVLIALLVVGVFIVQPIIAVGAILLFGGFYFFTYIWMKPRTRAVGDGLQVNNVGFGKNAYQFFQGIKTVFVYNKSCYFIDKALGYSRELGKYNSLIPIYSNGPRYLIEPIAFGGLVSIVVVLALQGKPFSDILPNLSVMALAAYRLLPALQMLYSQLVNITSNKYTLFQLEDEITLVEKETAKLYIQSFNQKILGYNNEINIRDLSFSYAIGAKPVLKKFNLTIQKNTSVGIAGASGSGKSTLVDLLLGLHTPTAGKILVDGVTLSNENMASWRSMIGYVPQDIYLIDDTIEANIAFGVESSAIDQAALRMAAQGAQILDFIENDLPEGFQTIVGERGVRLSGGQRQRIGLARALYHKPQILILDEATSALDHQTEAAVMETINKLQGTLTIITIAHRLSTLERCNIVIRLENGELVQCK
jgi:ATP-binding cassette subfamily C protein